MSTPLSSGEFSHLSGLEVIQGIRDGVISGPPIATHLNISLIEAEHGHVVFSGVPLPEVTNPLGSVHGGWYGAILDSAMGCAVHTLMQPNQGYTTLEYKVNITRSVPLGAEVRAIGKVQHAGRSTAVASAELLGVKDGKIYATGSTTCIILSAGKGS